MWAAQMLIELYGPAAANAAALRVMSAWEDGRAVDFRYWKTVSGEVRATADYVRQ